MRRILIACALAFIALPAAGADDTAQCQAKDPDVAFRGCTALIAAGKASPKDLSTAHLRLGSIDRVAGSFDIAQREYRLAIGLDPGNAEAHYDLGYSLMVGAKDLDTAVDELRQAVSLDPTKAQYHASLGMALGYKRDFDGAAQAWRDALARNPDQFEGHLSLGLALQGKGDLDGAIDQFHQEIARVPPGANTSLPHQVLANALRAKGDLAGAAAEYRHALDLSPKNYFVHGALGQVLQALGDLDGAAAEYRLALGIEPDYAAARAGLQSLLASDTGAITGVVPPGAVAPTGHSAADAFDRQRCDATDPDVAIAGCTAVLRMGVSADLALAYMRRGAALAAKHQVDAALADMGEAIRLDPTNADAFFLRAVTLATGKNQVERALSDYDEAIRLRPADANLHFSRGSAYALESKFDLALADYDEALRIDPHDLLAINARADAIVALGPKAPGAGPSLPTPPAAKGLGVGAWRAVSTTYAGAMSAHVVVGPDGQSQLALEAPSSPPVEALVVYQVAAGDQIKITVDGLIVNGETIPAHYEWTGRFDGADYPVTGDPTADTRAYHLTKDGVFAVTIKKAGVITPQGQVTLTFNAKKATMFVGGYSVEYRKQ